MSKKVTKKEEAPAEEEAAEEEAEPYKASIVLTVAGLGDQSFNDAAYRGLQQAESELGIDIHVYETSDPSEYEVNLLQAPSQDSDITFAIGFLMNDALTNAAPQNPDALYGIVDSVVESDNVASLLFKEEEGSFLVGVIAGMMTKSNKIGFLGGMEVPLIKKFESGFVAGVMTVNPEAEVIINYAGDFRDPAKGKEIALSQYASGADVIYHASGGTGVGLFQAVQEMGDGYWAIGVDSDQHHLAPENTLTSMMKRVDVAIYETIAAAYAGDFAAGTTIFGLAEGGVGLSPSTAENTPQEIIDLADEYAQRIISGEIIVPATEEELAEFTPPE